MGRLIIYQNLLYILYSFTEIYIYCLYDVTGCFCLGSLSGLANCMDAARQNEGRNPGRTCPAEAVSSCWQSTEAECFLIAG